MQPTAADISALHAQIRAEDTSREDKLWVLRALSWTLYEEGPFQDVGNAIVVLLDFLVRSGPDLRKDSYLDALLIDFGWVLALGERGVVPNLRLAEQFFRAVDAERVERERSGGYMRDEMTAFYCAVKDGEACQPREALYRQQAQFAALVVRTVRADLTAHLAADLTFIVETYLAGNVNVAGLLAPL